jgi:hypothetical protein
MPPGSAAEVNRAPAGSGLPGVRRGFADSIYGSGAVWNLTDGAGATAATRGSALHRYAIEVVHRGIRIEGMRYPLYAQWTGRLHCLLGADLHCW